MNPEMLYSSARIIGDVKDKNHGLGRRRGTIGTGFFLTVPSETIKDVRYSYLLTANHVIENEARVHVQAANPFGNGELHPPSLVDDWCQPLDDVDLAVAPYDPFNEVERGFYALEVENGMMPPDSRPSLGGDVFYIGYLEPLDRMMARSGTIGALDQEGIRHRDHYVYSAHLVDCRSYVGFSGSPCYAAIHYTTDEKAYPFMPMGSYWEPQEVIFVEEFTPLCGMFTQHLEEHGPRETDGAVSRFGVGVMLRSQEIWEALMSNKLRQQRREWDAENTKKANGPTLENVAMEGRTDEEFRRFEELTRQLVNTPKPKGDGEAK